MKLENQDSATSLLARARKALRGAETGAPVIARYAKTAPAGPGVYRMSDAAGEVLYVGKARHLKKRVQSYARTGAHNSRILRMIADTASMEFVTTATEIEALLLEGVGSALLARGDLDAVQLLLRAQGPQDETGQEEDQGQRHVAPEELRAHDRDVDGPRGLPHEEGPDGRGESAGYRDCVLHGYGAEVPVIVEGREVGRIAVRDLLP